MYGLDRPVPTIIDRRKMPKRREYMIVGLSGVSVGSDLRF